MPKPTLSPRAGSRPLRRLGLALAGLLTLALAVASGGAAAYMKYFDSNRNKVDVGGVTDRKSPISGEGSQFAGDITNVLLVGSDSREALPEEQQEKLGDESVVGGQRSDTLILLHLDPRKKRALLVHFPRDLRVEIPGHGTDKINTAYNSGGPELVIRTVKRLTSLPIHHYVEVNFLGFRSLVDALDGVEICVNAPTIDRIADLRLPKAGCYHLGGRKALAYVRARNVEGDVIPDFARIGRQQQFIRALLNQVLSVRRLLSPTVLREAARNFTTDADLTLTDMAYFAEQLKGFGGPAGSESVEFRVVPALPETFDGISYVVPVEPDASEFFARLKSGEPLGELGATPAGTAPSEATIDVAVLDGGVPARAAKLAGRLRRAGFVLTGVRRAPAGLMPRLILYRPGKEEEAKVLQGYFPKMEMQEATEAVMAGAEVAVVVGPKKGKP